MEQQGTTRREALKAAGGTAIVVFAGTALGDGGIAVAVEPGPAFLTPEELRQLKALVDVFIPADQDPGAVQGGCAEAIDALLHAFAVSPPRIYAGGPFSDRAGAKTNDFKDFLTLDAYEERAWRLRIEGSKGAKDLERNGPVKGWQQVYREGLRALADAGFADRSAAERELRLRQGLGPAVDALVEVAWPHTWQLMYGAPEYGGNKDLVGWRLAVWDGDVQPRGWSKEQVETGPLPGTTVVLEDLPLPFEQLLTLTALGGSSELVHNLLVRADGKASPLADAVQPVLTSKALRHGA